MGCLVDQGVALMPRKKQLIYELQCANARIAALEGIICPANIHDWFEDYTDECYICRRCGKMRWMD